MVHRVWQEAGLRPHRLERYIASNDPDFELKAADVIGLYLDPPQYAAVFCVDEKTAIQALDRHDRVLPLSTGPSGASRRFEYKRNGTLSPYAALNTQTSKVQGKTALRHTNQEFVSFLEEVVAPYADDSEIHIICDNLLAHKTKKVAEFLEAHPNVKLHFTPTYSSWPDQVELWFSKLQCDVIARGIFTSTADLARQLRRYINAYSKDAKPNTPIPSAASAMWRLPLRRSTRWVLAAERRNLARLHSHGIPLTDDTVGGCHGSSHYLRYAQRTRHLPCTPRPAVSAQAVADIGFSANRTLWRTLVRSNPPCVV